MRERAMVCRLTTVAGEPEAQRETGPLPPEILERLRRGVPLRLTAMGEFRWGDEDISHPRVLEALRRGLDVTEDGEPIVRLGHQWCYLRVEDTLLRATAVAIDGDTLHVRLDDGRTVALDPGTLWEEPGRGLRASVSSACSGRPVSVRFNNHAQFDLADRVEMSDEGPLLRVGARGIVIPSRPPG
jgi:hypothetical protein